MWTAGGPSSRDWPAGDGAGSTTLQSQKRSTRTGRLPTTTSSPMTGTAIPGAVSSCRSQPKNVGPFSHKQATGKNPFPEPPKVIQINRSCCMFDYTLLSIRPTLCASFKSAVGEGSDQKPTGRTSWPRTSLVIMLVKLSNLKNVKRLLERATSTFCQTLMGLRKEINAGSLHYDALRSG